MQPTTGQYNVVRGAFPTWEQLLLYLTTDGPAQDKISYKKSLTRLGQINITIGLVLVDFLLWRPVLGMGQLIPTDFLGKNMAKKVKAKTWQKMDIFTDLKITLFLQLLRMFIFVKMLILLKNFT